jgi:hypothetical protein
MRRLSCLLCALLVCASCSEPPQKEIDRAQGAIDAARAAGAEQYAPTEFAAATDALRLSHEAVDQRDYRLALSRAIDASERAQDAAKAAADGKVRARGDAETAIHTAAAAVQQLQTKMKAAEAARVPQKDLQKATAVERDAEQALQKARASLTSGDYLASQKAVNHTVADITAQIRALDDLTRTRSARRRR